MRWASWVCALSLVSAANANELCLAPHPDEGDLNVVCGGAQGPNGWIGYNSDDVPCTSVAMQVPCEPFGTWTISSSETDPFDNEGWLPTGAPLYLWYLCSGASQGLAAAAFDLVGSMHVAEFRPRDGFLNGGSASSLLLVAAGCPTGPLVAGEIYLENSTAIAAGTWSSVKALYGRN